MELPGNRAEGGYGEIRRVRIARIVTTGELLLDELDKVTLYRRNRAKLALSLLIIVEKCHTHGIQHNDLSPGNILLHSTHGQDKDFLGCL